MIQRVLAIETSCDDTSAAIVEADGTVLSLVSANQDAVHKPFGGIVPEIAGRNHTEFLLPIIEETLTKAGLGWSRIEGLAVTCRPGLVGSLLVGVVTTKALALAKHLPFVGVNHLEGHLLAPFLRDGQYQPPQNFDYPFVALAVSGGHTSLYKVSAFGEYEVLGSTVDDAAGEAFDKFAKTVGLGFPGGVKVDGLAKSGDPKAFQFPRAMMEEGNLNLSFSGLKTAAQRVVAEMSPANMKARLPDLCASYQEAIVETLITKIERVVKKTGIHNVVITGGVSANSRLRARGEEWAKAKNLHLVVPPIRYCTDNAAMIGYAGIQRLNRGQRSELTLGVSPEINFSEMTCIS